MFLITDMFFFHGDIELQLVRSDEKKVLNTLILVSFTFEKLSILQCRRLLPIAITNKNIIYLSVWNWRIAFSCTWFS